MEKYTELDAYNQALAYFEGDELAARVWTTYYAKKDKNDADLYVVDTDGNNLVQLTVNKSYDGQPYWTTDGFIYFVSDRGNDPGNYQIWRFKYE